jgi:hypothetical protein
MKVTQRCCYASKVSLCFGKYWLQDVIVLVIYYLSEYFLGRRYGMTKYAGKSTIQWINRIGLVWVS